MLPKPNGIADREHDVADLHVVERAERDRGQVLAVGLEHREVGLGIGAAHVAVQPAAVGEHELDVVGALDDVIVGEHVAFAADDHARAEARRAARFVVLQAREEAAQERVVEQADAAVRTSLLV